MLTLILFCPMAPADILLDDHFDDGKIDTGGTNGGFIEIGNGQDADIEISESNSTATIEFFSIQNNPNKGMVSIEPLDLERAAGFRATYVVNEVTDNRCCNGHFVGISDDNISFFRSIKNFGLAFFGRDDRTDSGDGFGLVINDIGNPGAEVILGSDDIEFDSYLDGFTASFTADSGGWSYQVSDVNDLDGEPGTFSDSGNWTAAGLEESFYADFFDDEEYAFVSSQIQSGDQLHSYDRITVESLTAGGLPGDFNQNGIIDGDDMDRLSDEVRASTHDGVFDLNDDSLVDEVDRVIWVQDKTIANTYFGDSNLDGEFSSGDLVAVFVTGEYEDERANNSIWATGDWDGNREFDSSDFVIAFAAGGYELGPRVAAQAIPEPSALTMLLWAGVSLLTLRVRKGVRLL